MLKLSFLSWCPKLSSVVLFVLQPSFPHLRNLYFSCHTLQLLDWLYRYCNCCDIIPVFWLGVEWCWVSNQCIFVVWMHSLCHIKRKCTRIEWYCTTLSRFSLKHAMYVYTYSHIQDNIINGHISWHTTVTWEEPVPGPIERHLKVFRLSILL